MSSFFSRWTRKSDVDEDTAKKLSPKVKRQLFILSIARFAEPVALTSVFPYLYFMVKSFGVPDKDIAFWVGITSASFSFSQFLTSIFWGRASDRFGRKCTILFGLCGTFFSLVLFGFARSLPVAIAARCMAGMLNGNVGIMRTLVAEIVPQKELQPVAFSLMPLVWAVGSIFGPIIGGYLSDPVLNHPDYFSPGGFFSKYPYALPNLAAATLIAVGVITGFLFLEETLESQKDSRDIGRELGEKLKSVFTYKRRHHHYKSHLEDENTPLLTPTDEEQEVLFNTPVARPAAIKLPPPPIRDAFTRQSTLNIIVYAFLALQSVAFDQLLPVFMSYPDTITRDPTNPLKFFGGFGLTSPEIGTFFSIFGFFAMLNQFFVFPPVTARYGSLACMKACACIFPLVYLIAPFAVFVPERFEKPVLFAIIFFKQMSGVFAFPCSTILLTNSAPSLRLLGTLNGVATATAALGRAIGPTIGGAAFSYGQRINYLILPWWLLATIALLGASPTWLLEEGLGFASNEEEAANKAKAKATAEAERGSGEGGYMGEVVIDGVEGHYEEAGWVDEEDDEEEEGGEGRPE